MRLETKSFGDSSRNLREREVFGVRTEVRKNQKDNLENETPKVGKERINNCIYMKNIKIIQIIILFFSIFFILPLIL